MQDDGRSDGTQMGTVGLNSRDEETVSERETRDAKKRVERMSTLEVFEMT